MHDQYKSEKNLRIFGISDLHLEFYPNDTAVEQVIKNIKQGSANLPEADVLVLAGDIGDPVEKSDVYFRLLQEFKRTYKNVVLVAGNHEHYSIKNYDRSSTYDCLKKICNDTGVIFLEKNSVIIQRVKFIGTTLWSMACASTVFSLGDFGRVYNDVTQYNEEFKQCYKWLEKELSQPVGRPEEPTDYDECVIVTHHLPSYHLCHERFKNCKDLNTAFYTDILEQLPMSRVKYWFCGHTHEFMVKKLKGKDGEVIVIVNPMGYPKEPRKTKMSLDVYMI